MGTHTYTHIYIHHTYTNIIYWFSVGVVLVVEATVMGMHVGQADGPKRAELDALKPQKRAIMSF
jgi:pyrimidine deaminase RibD-like protein